MHTHAYVLALTLLSSPPSRSYVLVMMVVLLQWTPPTAPGDELERACDAFSDFTNDMSYKVYQGIVNFAQQVITVALLTFGMRIVWTLNLLGAGSAKPVCFCCRGKMQCRLITAMVASAVCFTLHFCMSVAGVIAGPQNNDWINQNVWYFLDYWIPTIPPACLMLFLMRNVHRGDLEEDNAASGLMAGGGNGNRNRYMTEDSRSSGSGGSGTS